jgi:triacylglycerol lipase
VSAEARPPILIAHGIWDSEDRIGPLKDGLLARGFAHVHAFTFEPRDGRGPLAELARQIQREAEQLRTQHEADRIDLVGFSMGALTSRYYIQRLDGKRTIRRFVSISGPHRGTLTAYGLPFDGVRDMRPGSALIRDLETDSDPWGAVEAHCIYTPLDLTIIPATSSELHGARSTHRIPVGVHRWMIRDPRVLDLTAQLLLQP